MSKLLKQMIAQTASQESLKEFVKKLFNKKEPDKSFAQVRDDHEYYTSSKWFENKVFTKDPVSCGDLCKFLSPGDLIRDLNKLLEDVKLINKTCIQNDEYIDRMIDKAISLVRKGDCKGITTLVTQSKKEMSGMKEALQGTIKKLAIIEPAPSTNVTTNKVESIKPLSKEELIKAAKIISKIMKLVEDGEMMADEYWGTDSHLRGDKHKLTNDNMGDCEDDLDWITEIGLGNLDGRMYFGYNTVYLWKLDDQFTKLLNDFDKLVTRHIK